MNLTLRQRILVGYGVAMTLTIVVLAWGLINLLRLGQASNAILRENYQSIVAADEMREAIDRQQNAALLRMLGDRQAAIEQSSAAEGQFLLYLERAKGNITLEGEAEILQKLEQEYKAYLDSLTLFLQAGPGQNAETLTRYRSQLVPHVLSIRQGCGHLHQLNQTEMETESRRAEAIAHTAVWSMLVVGMGAVVAGVAFSFLLSARITGPLRLLMQATQQVAAGDYQTRISPGSRDEFGRLAELFNVMVTKLRVFNELKVGQIVAEKKKSEAILRSIDDGVLVVDSTRKITALNPAAAQALDIPLSGPEREELTQLIPDQQLLAYIDQALRTGRSPAMTKGDNYLCVQNGAREVHYEYSITPVQESAGKMLGVVVLLHNVTKLKELDRMKNEFVMTASHELRTPLTSIGMSIDLLREQAEDRFDQPDRELLDVAHEEVERLKTLVNELLDLTRMESGKIPLRFSEVSIPMLLETALMPFRSQAKEQSVELALQISGELPPVWADAAKLTLVVTNLVGNALRYTPAKGHVWVSAESAGPWVHIYVRDEGKGIPVELQAKIFDKFVQIDGAGRPGGGGLGLALAKEIVRAHHGSIWVESEPGKGSLFTVVLPALRSTSQGNQA